MPCSGRRGSSAGGLSHRSRRASSSCCRAPPRSPRQSASRCRRTRALAQRWLVELDSPSATVREAFQTVSERLGTLLDSPAGRSLGADDDAVRLADVLATKGVWSSRWHGRSRRSAGQTSGSVLGRRPVPRRIHRAKTRTGSTVPLACEVAGAELPLLCGVDRRNAPAGGASAHCPSAL